MNDNIMKETASVRQTKIFRKMSVTKKIELLDHFFRLGKELNKNDHKAISRQHKLGFRSA